MKKKTYGTLVALTIDLEFIAGRLLDQIDGETTPMWRNLFERMHVQISLASTMLDSLTDLVQPGDGGNSPDPWKEPLGRGLSSLEVLAVFQRAQLLHIDIRQVSFDKLRKLVTENNVLSC